MPPRYHVRVKRAARRDLRTRGFDGRDMRLTDVHGKVITEVLA